MNPQDKAELHHHTERYIRYLGKSMIGWRTDALWNYITLVFLSVLLGIRSETAWPWVLCGVVSIGAGFAFFNAHRDRQRRLAYLAQHQRLTGSSITDPIHDHDRVQVWQNTN